MSDAPKGSQINQLVGDDGWYTTALAIPSAGNMIVPIPVVGKIPGGTKTQAGLYTAAPQNKIRIRLASNYGAITDSQDRAIYARLTESSAVWTLTFYIIVNGSETPYDFSADIFPDQNPHPEITNNFHYRWCESKQLGNVDPFSIVERMESINEGPGGESALDDTKVTPIANGATEIIDEVDTTAIQSVLWNIEIYDSTASKVQSFTLSSNNTIVSGDDLNYQQYAIVGPDINYGFSIKKITGKIRLSITNNEANSITIRSRVIKL